MNKKTLIIFIILFFLLYGYGFYKLGNTLYRINSSNTYSFNILPLFTEGFIGPLRTIYHIIFYNNLDGLPEYLWFILTDFSSPYAVIIFLTIIYKLFKVYSKKIF